MTVESRVDSNYERIDKLIASGYTRAEAIKIISDEYDKLLEEQYLFERSL